MKEANKFIVGQIVWLPYEEHEYTIRNIIKNSDAENPFGDIYIYDLWNKEAGYKYGVKEENLLKTQGHNMFKKGKKYKCLKRTSYDFSVDKVYTSPEDGKLTTNFDTSTSMGTNRNNEFELIDNIREGDVVKALSDMPDHIVKGTYYLANSGNGSGVNVVLDSQGNSSNGWRREMFDMTKTHKVKDIKEGSYYMCIETTGTLFKKGIAYKGDKEGDLKVGKKLVYVKTYDYKKFRLIENSNQTEVTDTEENEWDEPNDDAIVKEGDIVKCITPDKGRNTSSGYSYGYYYLVKESTDNHITTYLDDNNSTSNGWDLSNFIIVDKCEVTKFIPDRKYMCIEQIDTMFTKGDIYISLKKNTLITSNDSNTVISKDHYERFVEIIDTSKDENPTYDWDDDDDESDIPEPETLPPELLDVDIKTEMKYMFPMPILLEGPVGSGKSTILIELAKELGLDYYASILTDQTSKTEFTGYKNVTNGKYVSTEFRKAYEFGGMFVLDELNGATSNMPLIFNSIDNGYFVFADKIVKAHKDFRLCASMNTITNAKDFGGRRVLDKSVEDRFHKIMVYGDMKSRVKTTTFEYSKAVDNILKDNGITAMVTIRDMIRYEKVVDAIGAELAIKKCMIKGKIEIDDKMLIKIVKEGNKW